MASTFRASIFMESMIAPDALRFASRLDRAWGSMLTRRTWLALVAATIALLLAVTPVMAGYATAVRHVVTDQRVIALTFDDGWSASRALQIDSILQQYGAT